MKHVNRVEFCREAVSAEFGIIIHGPSPSPWPLPPMSSRIQAEHGEHMEYWWRRADIKLASCPFFTTRQLTRVLRGFRRMQQL